MKIQFPDELKGERLVLKITKPTLETAVAMFKLVDQNRDHLRTWFKWVDTTLNVEDSFKYLLKKEEDLERGEKVEYGIYIGEDYIGNISLFDIHLENKSAEIGYWLSLAHTRKGYMTEAVKILEKMAFDYLELNRIQIKVDDENQASKGVAQKSHYILEGNLREYAYNKYFNSSRNLEIFSKLKSEYIKQ